MTSTLLLNATACLLFIIGLCGLLFRRRQVLSLFLSLELMLLAAATNAIAFSAHYHNTDGQRLVLFILAVGAAELAVAISLVYRVYRDRSGLSTAMLEGKDP